MTSSSEDKTTDKSNTKDQQRVIKPDPAQVKNYPDDPKAHIYINGRAVYVVKREYVYDKKLGRGRDSEFIYLGRIVDNVFYTMAEFHAKFKRNGKPRVPSAVDMQVPEVKPSCGELRSRYLGSTVLFNSLLESTGLRDDLLECFGSAPSRIVETLAMYLFVSGSCAHYRLPDFMHGYALPWLAENLSAPELSRFCTALGDKQENLNAFFEKRQSRCAEQDGFISYDGTCVDNESQSNLKAAGVTKSGNVGNQIHFAFAVGHKTRWPVRFTLYPGNIADISTVPTFIRNFHQLNKLLRAVCDRGYFSVELIKLCLDEKINILVGARVDQKFIRDAIDSLPQGSLETYQNRIQGHNCWGTTVKRDIGDGRQVWVHIYRRDYGRDMDEFKQSLENFAERWLNKDKTAEKDPLRKYFAADAVLGETPRQNLAAINEYINQLGYFASVTTYECTAAEAIEDYSGRDCIEKGYKYLKTDLGSDVLRAHSDDAIRARLLIVMVASTVINELRLRMAKGQSSEQKNGKVRYTRPLRHHYSLNQIRDMFKGVEAKQYADGTVVMTGITAKLRGICDQLNLPQAYQKVPTYVQGKI